MQVCQQNHNQNNISLEMLFERTQRNRKNNKNHHCCLTNEPTRAKTKRLQSLSSLSIFYTYLSACFISQLSSIQPTGQLSSNLIIAAGASSELAQTFGAGHTNHLSRYDSQVVTSSLGEPVFRLEPPPAATLIGARGLTLACLASGWPRPRISWFTVGSSSSQMLEGDQEIGAASNHGEHQLVSRPVTNITDLRHVSASGRILRFLPFKRLDYRPEIHSMEYRCVASNQHGTIYSRPVQVQTATSMFLEEQPDESWSSSNQPTAAKESLLEIKVNDEFVPLNGLAVFKCRPSLKDAASLANPITGNNYITPLGSNSGAQSMRHDSFGSTTTRTTLAPLEDWTLLEWFASDGFTIPAFGLDWLPLGNRATSMFLEEQPDESWSSSNQPTAAKESLLEIKVNDEFVPLNGLAVFKCRPSLKDAASLANPITGNNYITPLGSNSGAQSMRHDSFGSTTTRTTLAPLEDWTLLEWFASDGFTIPAFGLDWLPLGNRGSKFSAFTSGELHIERVEMRDLQRTYGCRMRHKLNGQIHSSSGLAQLISPDSSASAAASSGQQHHVQNSHQVQILHSSNQVIAMDSSLSSQQRRDHELPWAANQHQLSAASGSRRRYANSIQPDLNNPTMLETRLLMLPCAVRSGPEGVAAQLRWFFRQSGSSRPMEPLDNWAAQRGLSLIQLNQQQQVITGAGKQSQSSPRFIQGRTFMALEFAGQTQSGRYSAKLESDQGAASSDRTVCDIDVIIYEPIRVQLQVGGEQTTANAMPLIRITEPQVENELLEGDKPEAYESKSSDSWYPSTWLNSLFSSRPESPAPLALRQQSTFATSGEQSQSSFIKVQGPGRVPNVNSIRVGQRLQLDCLASGFPIDEVRWFKNGQLINIQSSQDFQMEISSFQHPQVIRTPSGGHTSSQNQHPQLNQHLSTLTIRQVQPKDAGLQMFECHAFNNLGDRARAGLPVLVVEWSLLQSADTIDGEPQAGGLETARIEATSSQSPPACPLLQSNESAVVVNPISHLDQLLDQEEEQSEGVGATDHLRSSGSLSSHFQAANWAARTGLVLESESVELICPLGTERLEWRRLGLHEIGSQFGAASGSGSFSSSSSNLNQLLTADSRFLANGSSLLIRVPSKRHDEGVYACRRQPEEGAQLAVGVSQTSSGLGRMLSNERQQQQTSGVNSPLNGGGSSTNINLDGGHQSSSIANGLVGSSSSRRRHSTEGDCSSLIESSLFGAASNGAFTASSTSSEHNISPVNGLPIISSISIRITAKPKIDPFEFSHNLEEGMRAVAVCAVISGQSPIDIVWFKNGQIMLPDDQVAIDEANGFTSTLIFHKIKATHSGFYTCVAFNPIGSANHTSRLMVNVAPYFIERPRSTAAVLNSNVMINCRAGGQPSPQIRWRKLVPQVAGQGAGAAAIGLGGGQSLMKMVPPPSGILGNNNNNFYKSEQQDNSLLMSQVEKNGSMIIKELELSDATKYICQASNNINPTLSEMIDLTVQSPAQFEVNYETVTVKRDAMIKFSCSPRGDQPMELEWFKGSSRMLPIPIGGADSSSSSPSSSSSLELGSLSSKYSEIVQFANPDQQTRRAHHRSLVPQSALVGMSGSGGKSFNNKQSSSLIDPRPLEGDNSKAIGLQTSSLKTASSIANNNSGVGGGGVKSSELIINFADRTDTGNFICRAKNQFGPDELTYRLIVQEAPDPPTNLVASGTQANSISLLWSIPFDGNSPISHYILEYKRQTLNDDQKQLSPTSSLWTRIQMNNSNNNNNNNNNNNKQDISHQLTTTSNANHSHLHSFTPLDTIANGNNLPSASLLVRQLSPRTTYHFRVAAQNSIGQSPFSPVISVQTAEEPPNSRVVNMRTQAISSSSMKLFFRAPSPIDDSAPIRGYYISHRKFDPAVQALDSSNQQPEINTNQQQQQSMTNDVVATSKQITDSVSSNGQWISTISISALNNTSSGSNYNLAAGIPLISSSNNNNNQLYRDAGVALAGASHEFDLTGLERNTKYEIKVQPFNSVGVGPTSEVLGQTQKFDRPGQPNLRLVKAGRQSFELQWSISDREPLTGFSLFYKNEYEDWQEIPLGLVYSYKIESLRCGNKYQIYLTAFNSVGRSDPSDVISARTEGMAPVAAEKNRFIKNVNITEVQLDMTSWKSGGCPITSYSISYKRHHDSKSHQLPQEPSSLALLDKFTIAGLSPATWYKLMVTAYNEAGPTAAEYVFSTLTLEGEPILWPHPMEPRESGFSSSSDSASHQESLFGNFWNRWLSPHSSWSQKSFDSELNNAGQLGNSNQYQVDHYLLPISCLLLVMVVALMLFFYFHYNNNNCSPNSRHQLVKQTRNAQSTEHRDGSLNFDSDLNHNHHQAYQFGKTTNGQVFSGLGFCQTDLCNGLTMTQGNEGDEHHELYASSSSNPSANGQVTATTTTTNYQPTQIANGTYQTTTNQQQQQLDSLLDTQSSIQPTGGAILWNGNGSSAGNSSGVDSVLAGGSPSTMTSLTGHSDQLGPKTSSYLGCIQAAAAMGGHFATLHPVRSQQQQQQQQQQHNHQFNNSSANNILHSRTLQLRGHHQRQHNAANGNPNSITATHLRNSYNLDPPSNHQSPQGSSNGPAVAAKTMVQFIDEQNSNGEYLFDPNGTAAINEDHEGQIANRIMTSDLIHSDELDLKGLLMNEHQSLAHILNNNSANDNNNSENNNNQISHVKTSNLFPESFIQSTSSHQQAQNQINLQNLESVIQNHLQDHSSDDQETTTTSYMIHTNMNNHNHNQQSQQHFLNHLQQQQPRLISSSSFVSGAELMQREHLITSQAQNLQLFQDNTTDEEPIYQRLDKLHEICNLRQASQQFGSQSRLKFQHRQS